MVLSRMNIGLSNIAFSSLLALSKRKTTLQNKTILFYDHLHPKRSERIHDQRRIPRPDL